ncbi:hypothetical protein Tco_1535340, partial [Tanacetum coccineum]
EEDGIEPGVILGRSFMRLTKELILDGIDFGDIPEINEAGLPPFVCKMGKSSRNKRRLFENHQINYFDEGPSLNNGLPLTQKEASREAIAIDIYKRFVILEEARPIKLDGEIKKEEEKAVKRVMGEALKEKEDSGAFIIPIRLEEKINLNALADIGSDINLMLFDIYAKLDRE